MRVYAGPDALTGKPRYLVEIVPPGPKAPAEAERVRTRLLSQVDERRNPKTRATLNQLLDRYREILDVEPTTRARYELDVRLRHGAVGVVAEDLQGRTATYFTTVAVDLHRFDAHTVASICVGC